MNRDTAFDQRRPRVILWRTIIYLTVYLFAARIVLECLKYRFYNRFKIMCTFHIFIVSKKFKGYVCSIVFSIFFANYVKMFKYCLKGFLKYHFQNNVKVM